MQLSPRPIQFKDFRTASKMAFTLVKRQKREAFLVFVLLPMLIFFIPMVQFKLIAYCLCLLFGVLFCMKVDSHQDKDWFTLVKYALSNVEPTVMLLITVIYMQAIANVDSFNEFSTSILSDFLILPVLGFLGYFLSLGAMLIALPVFGLGIGVYYLYCRYIKKHTLDDSFFERLPHFAPLTMFGSFLSYQAGLSWGDSAVLSREAVQLTSTKVIMSLSLIVVLTLMIFPLYFYLRFALVLN